MAMFGSTIIPMSKLLITGGTGSFGSALLERVVKDPRFSEVRVFSRDEKKQWDLMQKYPSPKVKFLIGDVRSYDSVARAVEGIDFVFHAAALKHVPSGEFFPLELVRTNILGTENVFAASRAAGVKKVVFLSSDKAVYPINTMGMTKALAEKIMSAYAMNSPHTVFCAVRYGNVMASRGSVIPLFINQIKQGKNITITNPEMTRFLLSLEDSMDLVELAMQKAEQGDIFIRKAPAVTIETLARALIEIFGSKNKLRVIGTRKGEKIHETLATNLELSASDDLGEFFKIKTCGDLDYYSYVNKGNKVAFPGDYTSENTERLGLKETVRLLSKLPFVKKVLKNEIGSLI